MDRQEQLDWEAQRRPRAGIAAIVAALGGLLGAIIPQLIFADVPRAGLSRALGQAFKPGPIAEEPSLRQQSLEYFSDNRLGLLASGLSQAIGLIALGLALAFLAQATRARRDELPKPAQYLVLYGGILSAIATLAFGIARMLQVEDFLDGPRTAEAAAEVGSGSTVLVAQLIGLPGTMALALGIVLIAINAMRSGLLTRFMGVLGVIVGALLIFPIGSPIPVVQTLWLVALGLLFLGRQPGPEPPAWNTGKAEPWPTSNPRMRLPQNDTPAADLEDTVSDPAPQMDQPHPSSKKRKRKRRA
jgi:hypothetical protein